MLLSTLKLGMDNLQMRIRECGIGSRFLSRNLSRFLSCFVPSRSLFSFLCSPLQPLPGVWRTLALQQRQYYSISRKSTTYLIGHLILTNHMEVKALLPKWCAENLGDGLLSNYWIIVSYLPTGSQFSKIRFQLHRSLCRSIDLCFLHHRYKAHDFACLTIACILCERKKIDTGGILYIKHFQVQGAR